MGEELGRVEGTEIKTQIHCLKKIFNKRKNKVKEGIKSHVKLETWVRSPAQAEQGESKNYMETFTKSATRWFMG